MFPKTCIVICGPTASGKTPLAIELAKEWGGCIINADSMQVYDHLKILTARPSEEERQSLSVPYFLDGVLSGHTRGSAGWWVKEASKIIKETLIQGRIPIVVGGTGLYLKCLMEGISEIPEIPRTIQQEIRALGATHTLPELQELLQKQYSKSAFSDSLPHPLSSSDEAPAEIRGSASDRDPRVKPEGDNEGMASPPLYKDKQRLLRALEVITATGKPIESFYETKTSLVDCTFFTVLLMPQREELYTRIDERFDRMMSKGALQEVEALSGQSLETDHPILKATGVVPLTQYLAHQLTLDEAIAKAKQDTRNFAKRQMTWFKGQIKAKLTLDPYHVSLEEQVALIKENL